MELSSSNPSLESSSKKGTISRNEAGGVRRDLSKTPEITERDFSEKDVKSFPET